MNLPKLEDLEVAGKKVIVRADLDVSGNRIQDTGNRDSFRLETAVATLKYLLEKEVAMVIIIGHRGRPGGKVDIELSLAPVAKELSGLIGKGIKFVDQVVGEAVTKEIEKLGNEEIIMLENLRFDAREEKNDEDFARQLAGLAEIYVNECFSTSHRNHTSFVGIPKLLPHAAGFHFVKEVESLSKVLENSKRPVIVVIGGVKKDKLDYLDDFKKFADKILVGGKLPEYCQDLRFKNQDSRIIIAQFNQDKEDITIHSIEKFEEEIKKVGTIVVAGPMGKFEENGQFLGTKRILEAVANSKAYKVAGGGDTEQAIAKFGLTDKFDWISVGGGATLQFLAQGTLPGIEALK